MALGPSIPRQQCEDSCSVCLLNMSACMRITTAGVLAVVNAGRGPTKGPKGGEPTGGMPTGGSYPMPKPPMCGKMKNHQYK